MNYFEPHALHRYSDFNRHFTKICILVKYLWNRFVLIKQIFVQYPNCSLSFNRITHSNWGDDLNMWFLPQISKDCIVPGAYLNTTSLTPITWLSKYPKYRFIGSVISFINKEESIIWGSGLISDDAKPHVKKLDIRAVRGPLTQRILEQLGYDCPKVYGDPALLLPYYVLPKQAKKKYKLGIIPHYTDFDKEELDKYRNVDGILIIKMFGYKSWTAVIDDVCSCEFIISSSLHGIIVSEAYHIPNLWVEVREPIVGRLSNRFKFHDFFASLGTDRPEPYTITKETTFEDILYQKKYYVPSSDYSIIPLVESCPFELKKPIKPFV